VAYVIAAEICIEILSPSNTQSEMDNKKALYFTAGASEFWMCTQDGELQFYNHQQRLLCSELIPSFPEQIDIDEF
jgi:Uma2 family endonuclease